MVTKRVLHRTMTSSTRCFRLRMDCSSSRHSSGWPEDLQWQPGTAKGLGGRKWESNPPGTAWQPHLVLKTSRPTGGDFLPLPLRSMTLTATATVLLTPSVHLRSNWSGHGILPEEIKQVASTDPQARNQAHHQALSPSHPRRKPGTTNRQSIGRRPLHQSRPGQTRHTSGLARA